MKKRRWVVVLLAALAVLVAGGGAAAFALDRARSDDLAHGVRIVGMDVGGMTTADARALLERRVVGSVARPIVVVDGTRRFRLTAADANVHVDVSGMVETARERSRSGSFVSRVYREATGGRVETRIRLRVTYSRPALQSFVARIAHAVDRPAQSATVDPTPVALKTAPSHDGRAVYQRGLVRVLENRLLHPRWGRIVPAPIRVVRPEVSTAQLAAKYPAFILIDRNAFTLRLFRHLRFYKAYRIAVGRQGLETPAGEYEINDRQINPSWHVPNSPWAGSLAGRVIPPGPDDPIKARWLGFYNGAGIHGTDDIGSLGTAASHGCIRMSIPDVEELFPLVPLHTPIYVA